MNVSKISFFLIMVNSLFFNTINANANSSLDTELLSDTLSNSTCTDYNIVQKPNFNFPKKRSFRHFGNRLLSAFYNPFHMTHDEIVNPREPVTIVGKFDYDWILHKDLEDEDIHAYIYGSGMSNWEYLGEFRTNRDGKIFVPVAGRDKGDYVIRMVVEGDHSVTDGYLSVRHSNHQAVLFDIDGTLTLSDAEQIGDYLGIEAADAFYYAQEMVQTYRTKGYQLIFLTARPYWMARSTRTWLKGTLNQASWHLRTNTNAELPSSITPGEHKRFKREYIQKLKNNGIEIIRAYGNASTDIAAYAEAGISKSDTFIIGKHAGESATQPIYGDYSSHYFNVVVNTPNAICMQ